MVTPGFASSKASKIWAYVSGPFSWSFGNQLQTSSVTDSPEPPAGVVAVWSSAPFDAVLLDPSSADPQAARTAIEATRARRRRPRAMVLVNWLPSRRWTRSSWLREKSARPSEHRSRSPGLRERHERLGRRPRAAPGRPQAPCRQRAEPGRRLLETGRPGRDP